MKQIIQQTLIVVLLLTGISAQAQGNFTMGFKAGVNLSKLSMGNFLTTRYDDTGNPYLNYNGQVVRDNLDESIDSKTGWSGGVYMRFGRGLYIQPEVLVSTKGGFIDIRKGDNSDPSKVSFKYSSIDIPILVGLKGGPFRLNAGPVISYRVGDKQGVFDAIKHYTNGTNMLKEGIYGYQLGAGLDLGGISIDVRREGSFSDLSSFQVNTANAATTTVKQKLKSWQVTVGFRIF